MADETRRGGGGGRLTTGGTLPHAGIRVFGDEEVSLAKRFVLKSADMKDEMQKEAINCALSAFDKHAVEKDIAEYIKKEFDKNHGPTWHCIVGRNFGSYVTHETNHFIYFYLDKKAVLLFKSG
ncbi:hypothetical protein KSP40_PGU004406 [Platanthera guangdongensis]|uniref:Dynein light chain n=1 Tax=Platanthera guangdongensis TaxID=2320717 RepID=A0ABR2M926_9ASPA